MRNMRVYRSLQAKIGEIDISKIKLDENSKDDIQRALRGIQTLYLSFRTKNFKSIIIFFPVNFKTGIFPK